jgi:hypothetical protein
MSAAPLYSQRVDIIRNSIAIGTHTFGHNKYRQLHLSNSRAWRRIPSALKLSLKGPDLFGCFKAHCQSPSPRQLRKHTRSQGLPPPALPGLDGHTTLSDTRPIHRHKRCCNCCPHAPQQTTRINYSITLSAVASSVGSRPFDGGFTAWELGHSVRLMPPAYVKPYVKRQKNDMQ